MTRYLKCLWPRVLGAFQLSVNDVRSKWLTAATFSLLLITALPGLMVLLFVILMYCC